MNQDIFSLLLSEKKNETALVLKCNNASEQFGLVLSEDDAKKLIVSRNQSLKKHKRVEFGNGILDKLIFAFCDSSYINQDDYLETLEKLQDIFYEFKNKTEDKVTDEELISIMRDQFENVCFGDINYLAKSCLEDFANKVKHGYKTYQEKGGVEKYRASGEAATWHDELYYKVLENMDY